jgi:propionyl-CoA carboxylase beta chain
MHEHSFPTRRSSDLEKEIIKQTEEYQDKFANPFVAASRGYLDDIITPHNTRYRLSSALELLKTKELSNPKKKHGNIPL